MPLEAVARRAGLDVREGRRLALHLAESLQARGMPRCVVPPLVTST